MSKYPRTYHVPFSKSITTDDKISKLEDFLIFLQNDFIITEKLDGQNQAMTKTTLFARSHSSADISPWSVKIRMLHQQIKHDLEDDVYLFGESLEAIHSIEYDILDTPFYLFGVRKGKEFLSWQDVLEYAYLLNLKTVPIIDFKKSVNVDDTYKKLENFCHQNITGSSKFGPTIEGYVFRNQEFFKETEFSKNVFKYVRPNHVTTDQHWTKNWRKAKILNF